MPDPIPVDTLILRRLVRAGACPVLEVTVTYPHIPDGESPAAARFNHTYRAMAEAFLAWADTLPAEEAKTAFADMGAAAPYRFDRRILTCTMTAVSKAPDRLAVIRSVTLKSRRGEMPERSITASDLWRLPAWTVVKHPKRSPKKHEKQGI
jgi:hypothetical protein